MILQINHIAQFLPNKTIYLYQDWYVSLYDIKDANKK